MNVQTLRKILTEHGGSISFSVKGLEFIISFTEANYVNKPLLLINGWPQKSSNVFGSRFGNFINKYIKDNKVKAQFIYLLYLNPSYTFNFKIVQQEEEILSNHFDLVLLTNLETI